MSKKKDSDAVGPQATITIPASSLTAPLIAFKGEEVRDPDGNPTLLGDVLLNLVGTMDLSSEPANRRGQQAMIAFRVGQRIAEAMEKGEDYEAGETAIGMLRRAAAENRPGYFPIVMGHVWLAIGTGDAE